jgi:outer membrane protein OmpA-like peptidoglycan-associated protein
MIKIFKFSTNPILFTALCIYFCILNSIFGQGYFIWKLEKDDILEINKFGLMQVDLYIYANTKNSDKSSVFKNIEKLSQNRAYQQFKNKIILKIKKVDSNQNYHLDGKFFTYIRPDLYGFTIIKKKRFYNTGAAFWKDSEFLSKFTLKQSGKYLVPDKYLMPNLRHMPTFPTKKIKKGARWVADGEEIIYQRNVFKIPVKFPVTYTYYGQNEVELPLQNGGEIKRVLDVFEFAFQINYTRKKDDQRSNFDGRWPKKWDNSWQDKKPDFFANLDKLIQKNNKLNKKFPLRILGESRSLLYFDRNQGIPLFDRNNYKLDVFYPQNRLVSYRMVIDTFYKKIKPVTDDDKDRIVKLLKKRLLKKKPPYMPESSDNKPDIKKDIHKEPIQIEKVKKGVKFTIRKLLFDYDSSELTSDGKAVLDKIAAELHNLKNRDIHIAGFTDSTGSETYNYQLSERRAKTVSDYLVGKGINANRLSYKGYGERNPVADNNTKDGRQLNRRVEITILAD